MANSRAGLYGPEAILEVDGTPARSVPVLVFDENGTTPSLIYTDAIRTSTVVQPIATDTNGNLTFYAEAGIHVLTVRGVNLTVQIPVNPTDDVTVYPLTFSVPGVQTVGAGTSRFYLPEAATLRAVVLSVGTPPTGQPLIVDVNYDGTSIYTGIPASRPQVNAGANIGHGGAASVTDYAADHYLSVDRDQIGSGAAGAELVVTILLQRRT